MNTSYDCIVIGGGPAGSTAAALVASAGFSTLLLERDKFPRYHIGESLMPETYWTFKRLGILDKLKASHFPKKFSVKFVSHTGRESQPFYFHDRYNHESSQTWQVLRSEFDLMLLENARQKGAEVRQETRVSEVLFEGDRAVGVRIQSLAGQTQDVSSKVIIDASGQQSTIAHRLGLREIFPNLRNAAIWGYYRGARRDPGIDNGAILVLRTTNRKAWFWFIPLPDDIVSLGVVAKNDYLLKGRGKPEEVYEEELVNCPAVVDRLVDAELTSEFRVARDFSYVSHCPAGDGWVLAGDAHGFLDPLYSSGVLLALKGGEMSADAVIEGLTSGDTSAAQLGKWAETFRSGMECVRRLVMAFYAEEFSFGEFLRAYPHHKGNITDLLIGKVFHPEAADVFQDLDPWIARIEGGAAAEAVEASD